MNPFVLISIVVFGAVFIRIIAHINHNPWVDPVVEKLLGETEFEYAFCDELEHWSEQHRCFNCCYYGAMDLILPRYLPRAIFLVTDSTEEAVSCEITTGEEIMSVLEGRFKNQAYWRWQGFQQLNVSEVQGGEHCEQ